jgi:hypothetical protein
VAVEATCRLLGHLASSCAAHSARRPPHPRRIPGGSSIDSAHGGLGSASC